MLRQQSRTRQAEGRQQDSGASGSDGRKPSNRTLSFGALMVLRAAERPPTNPLSEQRLCARPISGAGSTGSLGRSSPIGRKASARSLTISTASTGRSGLLRPVACGGRTTGRGMARARSCSTGTLNSTPDRRCSRSTAILRRRPFAAPCWRRLHCA